MPRYFNKFPKLIYKNGDSATIVTNLLTRIDTIRENLNNSSLFYLYNIQEGDTPEIVASKYYNDPELHWIVMVVNEIYDPFYDWPMTYSQFESFIVNKYGSVAAAKSATHHYEKIIESNDGFNTTRKVYEVDLETFNNTPDSSVTRTFPNGSSVTVTTTKRAVDFYDYEEEQNESKREIKLIRADLIPDIKKQFEFLMSR